MSLLLRLRARPDGHHELLASTHGRRTVFALRPHLSREVAEAVFADLRTIHILERWARAPDDQMEVTAAVVGLQVLVEQVACAFHGVEPEYLEARADGT